MPAVHCAVGPVNAVVARSPQLASAILAAVETWVTTPPT
jgi:hypothetical protein